MDLSKAHQSVGKNCLLLAMPQLADPNFFHTASLMVSFDGQGAFALIVNRPTEITLGQIIGDQIDLTGIPEIPVFFGGPVQVNSLWFLHGYREFHQKGVEVYEDIFLTTDLNCVQEVLNEKAYDNEPKFRFLLGYAGWSPGQLEKEISQSSWVMGPIDNRELFHLDPQQFWKCSLSRMGIADPNALVAPMTSGSAH